MNVRGRICGFGRSSLNTKTPRSQVEQLPALFERAKSHSKIPPMKADTPVNSRFSAEEKLLSLLKDMNVDLRKMNFSLNYYLEKLDDVETQLQDLVRASCFVFLMNDAGCDLSDHKDNAEEFSRRERNHYAPRDKIRVIKQGVCEERVIITELEPELARIEDEIISTEDECAALNEESMSTLGSLGVVCGF